MPELVAVRRPGSRSRSLSAKRTPARSEPAPSPTYARDLAGIARYPAGFGQPLDGAARDTMEARLGASLAGVRVHTGPAAARSARALDATAYTIGDQIVVRTPPDMATPTGRRLIFHELVHVLQQSARRETPRRVGSPGTAAERQAADLGERLAVGAPLHQPLRLEPVPAGTVQRQPTGGGATAPGGAAPPAAADTSRWPFGGSVPADIRAAYIDERAVAVAVKRILGTVFITLDDDREIELPLAEFREVSYNFVPILPGAPTRELAQAQAGMLAGDLRQRGLEPVAFYRDASNLFIPTLLTYQTLPRIWPAYERAAAADRGDVVATEKTFGDVLWWYVGARFPAETREPAATPTEPAGKPPASEPAGKPPAEGGAPEPQPSGPRRAFHKPTATPDPGLPAGEGYTDKFGDMTYSTKGTATDVALARNHELVHSILSPKLKFLRNLRADLRMAAYEKSAFLKYLEEALAETYAQVRVRGLKGLPTGITFPVKNGYVTVRAVVTEAAIGTVVAGGVTYGVYVIADGDSQSGSGAAAPASPPVQSQRVPGR